MQQSQNLGLAPFGDSLRFYRLSSICAGVTGELRRRCVQPYAVGGEDFAQPRDPVVMRPALRVKSGRSGTGDVLRLVIEEEALARSEGEVRDDVLEEGGRWFRCADVARVVLAVEDLAVESLLLHSGRPVSVLIGRQIARRACGSHPRNDLEGGPEEFERRPHPNDVIDAIP